MKKLFLIFSLFSIFFGNILFGQIIITDPPFPTDMDEVILTFDATTTALEGYTGDVYTHTGVIIEGSPDWKYVIGSWGNNQTQPQLTSLGNNLYELLISPNIRDFYGVNENDTIRKMAFVFRSSDANTQTADLFVDVFETGLCIIISKPEQDRVLAQLNDTIEIVAISPLADSIFLYLNDVLIEKIKGNILSTYLIADPFGSYWLDYWVKIVAEDSEGMVADSFSYFVIPPPTIEDVPENIVDGINYLDTSTAILSLYAPFKDFVFLTGDFNDWEVTEDFYMKKNPDGDRYWLQVNNLEKGKEYIFQYFIDGEIKTGDPYADKTSDPWNDKYITNSTYPGLIEYPYGKTTGVATVFQTAQQAYEWETQNFQPPEITDLVIYEMLIRDFTTEHTYQSLIDTLGYLKRLGVNAIELMPINEFEGNISWGYNPSFYFVPDKYYGPKNDLKHFIDVCHSKGIAVLIDLVLNHSYDQSPFVQMYFDGDNPTEENPWYNVHSNFTNPDAQWGNDFNHESPATQQLVDSINHYWMSEYKVDGFRFDFTKGFGNNIKGPNDTWGSLYDADRIVLLKRMADEIWNVNPDAFIIFEHLAENSEEKELANYGILLWGNLHYNYGEASMGWNENGKSAFSWISYQERNWDAPHVMGYMESHDEERLMYKNFTWGNSTNPDYNIKDTTIALQREALVATFFFTIPGPKMVWQFGEMGYDYSINWPCMTNDCRCDPKPPRWDYLDNWKRKYLFHVYAALIDLKKNYPVFESSNYTLSLQGAMKNINIDHTSMSAVIVGNFGVEEGTITPGFIFPGTWYEFFTQDEIVVSINESLTLAPGEYRLYTSTKIEKPEWLNTGIEDLVREENKQILSAYPNPSTGNFTFSLNLDEKSNVRLDVADIYGKTITTIFDCQLENGQQFFNWNGCDESGNLLPPGIYIARLTTGNFIETIKIIIND